MTTQKNQSPLRWLLSAVVIALLALGFSHKLDRSAEAYLEQSFTNALATFALVRGINAVISVAQGTEVAVEPGGVGVIVTPGEILDPINDLIERFSWVVLAAGTALGAQLIFLNLGDALLVQLLLLAAGAVLLVRIWSTCFDGSAWRRLVVTAALVIVGLRFVVPLVVLANEWVYSAVLHTNYTQSYTVLEQVGSDIKSLERQGDDELDAAPSDDLFGGVKRLLKQASDTVNVGERYKVYEAKVAAATRHIINLIAIFVFHTVVFPLLFLWLSLKLLRVACGALMGRSGG